MLKKAMILPDGPPVGCPPWPLRPKEFPCPKYHSHTHTHNRSNPNDPCAKEDPNTITDHHNPLEGNGFNSTPNFEHEHPHQHHPDLQHEIPNQGDSIDDAGRPYQKYYPPEEYFRAVDLTSDLDSGAYDIWA